MPDNFANNLLEEASLLDKADIFTSMRKKFHIPDGIVYLDGNSLGMQPLNVRERMRQTIEEGWAEKLISGWFEGGWMDLPIKVGSKIASLMGAKAGEVICGESTSVNIFRAVMAAINMRPGRNIILCAEDDFPTDKYIMQGLLDLFPQYELQFFNPDNGLQPVLHDKVAVILMSHIHYKTAKIYNLEDFTKQASQAGALLVWDFSHAIGAIPLNVQAANIDMAIGCSYKYLNGGPGAPAWIYLRSDLADIAKQPLSGWHGHIEPFAFAHAYKPAPGMQRFLCGTPQILSLSALDASLELWQDVDVVALRKKSSQLTKCFMEWLEKADCLNMGVEIISPEEDAIRGGHVALKHQQAGAMMEKLAANKIVGDFRPPDLMRFGFAPLYNSFSDAAKAVLAISKTLQAN